MVDLDGAGDGRGANAGGLQLFEIAVDDSLIRSAAVPAKAALLVKLVERVRAGGLGCEPASAASVAGARKLRQEGVIAPSERVVCILTGHQLKDPTATVAYHSTDQKTFDDVLGKRGVKRATYANRAVQVPNDLDEIIKAIELYS